MTNGKTISSGLRKAAAGFALLILPLAGLAGPIIGDVPLGQTVTGGRMYVAKDGNVTATFSGGDAAYTSSLFVYSPSERRGQTIFSSNTAVGTQISIGSFAAGTELVFGYFVHDTGKTYLSGPAAANSDGVAHARATTTYDGALDQYMTAVGMEDLWGGGDADYNDFQFLLSNVVDPMDVLAVEAVAAGAVPEPGPLALLGIGALVFGFMGRRTIKRR